ncbi:MAG: 50S ribosomal protein L11 methyltransferase, partial [Dechloromonas sp.]|nr:50S ribosomal protein L11 methyltransferase [Dechloromonas sp.]
MSWQNVCFLTDASHAEPMCDALLEAGALSASIEDADAGTPDEQPQFGEPGSVNTPGWAHSKVVVLLEPDVDPAVVLGEAARAIGLAAIPAFSVEPVAEQNWVQLTQSQFD